MGEDSPPPALDELPEEETNYWLETTTISVKRITKQQLDHERDGKPWDEYLEQLRREHADPLTVNNVDDITDRISDQIDTLAYEGALSEDDAQRIESSLSTIEERTGRIEKQLDDLGGH